MKRMFSPIAFFIFCTGAIITPCFTAVASAAGAGDENVVERKYAPDRTVDVEHIIIDVTPDFNNRSVEAVTTLSFKPIAQPLSELKLDMYDLLISSVKASVPIAGYNATKEDLTITFEKPIEAGSKVSVTVASQAHPKQGMYFRTPQLGYNASDIHLFSQGESHTHRYWFPSYDYPNERFTSEIICHVPKDYTVLSNGRLVSENIDQNSGLKTVRWLQEKPHVNYLIALVAGKFEKLESKHRNIPLAFYTTPSNIQYAQNSFERTAEMMDFFERETGVNFPWNQYYQVCVRDFVAGGMENTTLTVLTDRTLFTDEFENIRSSDGLIAHEMAHQWFGDYITCKDWSHLWINEGFATYYEVLYEGFKDGKDQMLYSLYRTSKSITAQTEEQRPIVFKEYRDSDEQFDYRNYGKGGWVLHMLRCQLGEQLYRECVKTFLERYGLSSVVTEDFVSVVEELSGRSYDRFFDQFVRLGRFPELKVSYNWSQSEGLAKVSIRQVQKELNNIYTYYFPVKIRFVVDGKNIDKTVDIESREHDFYFPLPSKPSIVRFDPDFTLLAKIEFEPPRDMLYAQLENKDDVIGRLLAIETLGKEKDKKTVDEMKKVLNDDPFYAVRIEASKALKRMGTDEAFAALSESMKQTDARVRRQVVSDIGSTYRSESYDKMIETIENEKNPDILAECIENIGLYHSPQTKKILVRYLDSDSFRNRLAEASINGIRKIDDPNYIAVLRKTIENRKDQLETSTFVSALDTLAYLARERNNKTPIRQFLEKYVDNQNPYIKTGAIRALGTLGDVRAKPLLESFISDSERGGDVPRRRLSGNYAQAARTALDKLNKEEKFAPAEVIELRQKIDEMKKETDKLKNDLEDMKKKISASEKSDNNKGKSIEDVNKPADANE